MALFVYITTSSPEEAERIATDLVEQRLAACVNILAPVTSVYQWEGRMCSEQEIPLIAKTEDDRFEALASRVRLLHGYTTPCVVALPLVRGTADFLEWIHQSTRLGE